MRKVLLFAVLLLAAALAVFIFRSNRLSRERDRYRGNTVSLIEQMQRLQADSAAMSVDVRALRLTVEEFKEYRKEDAEKIKKMGIKIKNLEAAAQHRLQVDAPLKAEVKDTVIVRDTVMVEAQSLNMDTPYVKMGGLIEGGEFSGNVQIPVTLRQTIWVEYKRYWLFWRRPKAVHQTITSDNPHVKISYSEYIQLQK